MPVGALGMATLKAWRHEALVLVAGASMTLAFAPFGAWFWAPVPLAILIAAARGAPWRRAILRGWLFGIGQFASGIFWIAESFQYNALPYSIAWLATAGLVLILAVYPACYAGLFAGLLGSNRGGFALLGWSAGWVLFEWLRGTLFTGFTWLQVGLAQVDGPLSGWLPITGTYGTGFIVALTGAALVGAFDRKDYVGRLIAAAGVAAITAGSALLSQANWTEPGGAALTVALVQGNVSQDKKWQPEYKAPTLAQYLNQSRRHWGAGLVVWPETAVPGLLSQMTDYLAAVEAEARQHGTELVVGIPNVDEDTGRGLNTVVKLGGEDGGALYVKRHLVPFGEYVPLAGLLEPILEAIGLRLSNFQAGAAHQALLWVRGVPVGVTICYEAAFAEEVRRSLPQAKMLINVSNDAWFGDTIGPHQHFQMARVRAREAGRWLARATNTGITAVVDHRGQVRAIAPQFEVATLRAEVTPYTGQTPYVRIGDLPVVLALTVIIIGTFAAGRKKMA